jgi:hypothetical protein
MAQARLPATVCAAVALLGLPVSAQAGNSVIQDTRLHLLGTPPSPGRGYSLQSNRMKSLCIREAHTTSPTFDFTFEIEEFDRTQLHALSHRVVSNPAAAAKRVHLLRAFRHLAKKTVTHESDRYRTVIAHLHVSSYRHALDESRSVLSRGARRLLKDQHLPEFFANCGFYYVRSVNRMSSFIGLLRYRRTEELADREFHGRLERSLMAFGRARDGGDPKSEHKELASEAQTRDLQLVTHGIGLAGSSTVNLFPTTLPAFRETLQKVGRLMQNAEAGVVTAMEIAPWLEHPDVDELIDERFSVGAASFESLHNLEVNAELIATIWERRDQGNQAFARARLCREHLLSTHPLYGSGEPGARTHGDPDSLLFINQLAPADAREHISLRTFYRYFVEHPPEHLRDATERLMRGGEVVDNLPERVLWRSMHNHAVLRLQNVLVGLGYLGHQAVLDGPGFFGPRTTKALTAFQKKVALTDHRSGVFDSKTRKALLEQRYPGTYKCIEELLAGGMSKIHYMTVPACMYAFNQPVARSGFVEAYCMPTPVATEPQ